MRKLFSFLILFIFCLSPCKAEETIIGCVNGTAVYKSELDRAFQAELSDFQQKLLFDPWQVSSYDELEARRKAVEEARKKNILLLPADVAAFKNLFAEKVRQLGSPVNTYDLNSYAEENAQLMNLFQDSLQDKIKNRFVERILLFQEAQNRHLTVLALEVESRLQQLKTKYKQDADFREFLRRNNTSELELRAALEEAILTEKLKQSLIAQQQNSSEKSKFLLISDENQFFENWFKQYKASSQINFAENGSTLANCFLPQSNQQQANDLSTVKYTVQLPPLSELEKKNSIKNKYSAASRDIKNKLSNSLDGIKHASNKVFNKNKPTSNALESSDNSKKWFQLKH